MADARSGVPVADSPICNIGGGRVALGPIMRPHLPAMQRWFSDPDTLLTAGIGVMPWTMERLTTWYEGRTSDDDAVWFTVYSLPGYRQIGFAGLRDIDYQSRSAEYAITIGEADARGQGYGTEVTRLIVSYAFDELGLESIGLDTVEYNHGARRAYEKAGFREIGRRKRAEAVGGRLWDAVLMECVKPGEPQSPVRVPVPGEGRQRAAAAGEPVLLIVGERIGLGPASRSQLPNYQRWFNDFGTIRTQGDPLPAPRTLEEISSWYDGEMSCNPRRAWFSAYALDSLQHIGFVELHHIDHRNRTATMSMMVGEPGARGKGYGSEMASLIVRYGFETLGLRNIALEVYEFNLAGQRVYEKAGFREFARRHQAHMMGGRLWDIVLMEAVSG
jgi:diamine N-acetyltransferase